MSETQHIKTVFELQVKHQQTQEQKRIDSQAPSLNSHLNLEVFKQVADQHVRRLGKKEYKLTPELEQIIKELCLYFQGKSAVLNSHKGLLLLGNPGSSKTTILEVFQRLLRNPLAYNPIHFKSQYTWTTIESIRASKMYATAGWQKLNPIMNNNWNLDGTPCNLMIDDLFREPKERWMGGEMVDVSQEIIDMRELQWRKTQVCTHATTNLDEDQMKQRGVSERTISRMHAIFNWVPIGAGANSEDFRKVL